MAKYVNKDIRAREAIFGFIGWLSLQGETIQLGRECEAAKVAGMAIRFCDYNNLPKVRGDWVSKVGHPGEYE